MKRLRKIQFFIYFMLIFLSCSKPEDGGTGTTKSFYLQNNIENNLIIVFISDTDTIKIPVNKNETIQLVSFSPPPGDFKGVLSTYPYKYNSAEIYLQDSLTHEFEKSNCSQENNPLCEDNYKIIKDETNKKGNRYIDFKFILDD